MKTRRGGWSRPIIAVALLVTLAGCSMLRLAYSQADVLMYRWLDDYVDFSTEQAPRARAAVSGWLEWHRSTQVPDYAERIDRAATEVLQDTTPERACRWFADFRTILDTATQRALPDAAALGATLSPAQLERIASKQRDSAEELREEYLQPDPDERREKSVERAVERTEQIYGRLEPAQREALEKGIAASPFDPERWLAERDRRNRDLLDALRQISEGARTAALAPPQATATLASAPAGTELLRAYWQRVLRSPDESYRRYAQTLDPYNCELAARVHNLSTPAQRDTAAKRLRGWQQDLAGIARPG